MIPLQYYKALRGVMLHNINKQDKKGICEALDCKNIREYGNSLLCSKHRRYFFSRRTYYAFSFYDLYKTAGQYDSFREFKKKLMFYNLEQ